MCSTLDAASKYAFAQLEKCGGAVHMLPIELQTVVVIYSVQGIIDNGGLQYLFESDFPDNPPYQLFVDAYRRVGAERCAVALQSAVSLFQCDDAHLDMQHRNNCLSKWNDLADHPFWSLDSSFDSEDAWRLVERYVRQHSNAFKIA